MLMTLSMITCSDHLFRSLVQFVDPRDTNQLTRDTNDHKHGEVVDHQLEHNDRQQQHEVVWDDGGYGEEDRQTNPYATIFFSAVCTDDGKFSTTPSRSTCFTQPCKMAFFNSHVQRQTFPTCRATGLISVSQNAASTTALLAPDVTINKKNGRQNVSLFRTECTFLKNQVLHRAH